MECFYGPIHFEMRVRLNAFFFDFHQRWNIASHDPKSLGTSLDRLAMKRLLPDPPSCFSSVDTGLVMSVFNPLSSTFNSDFVAHVDDFAGC